MKTFKFFIFLIVLIFKCNSSAQILPGAKQISLSHADVALGHDVFAHFTNPGGLAQINWREIGIYYSPSPFGLSELSNAFFAYNEFTPLGSFSIGFMTYGFELYRDNKLSVAYSNLFFRRFLAGLKISYHSISIKSYGNSSAISFMIGSIIYLNQNLRFGFTFDNFTRATFGDSKDQIPTIFNLGFSYDLHDELIINSAFEKELNREHSINLGIDYLPIQYLNLRFGYKTYPASFSAGVGINYSFFEFDYATFNHQDLGFTHQFAVVVYFSDDLPRMKRIKQNIHIN